MHKQLINIDKPIIGIEHRPANIADGDFSTSNIPLSEIFSNSNGNLEDQITVLENALQSAREESFKVGYEEGKEAGIFEMKKNINELTVEFEKTINSLKNEYDESLKKMKEPLVQLSISIAEKIIGTELNNKDSMSKYLSTKVQDILKDIKDKSRITIHVNPSRMEWVSNSNLFAHENLPTGSEISFVGDEQIQPGECMVETDDFIIDHTFQYQLETLKQQMLKNSEL